MRSRLFEGRNLKPSARTLWEVQAFAQKPPVEVSTNLYMYIRAKAEKYIEASRAARRTVTDMEDLKARRREIRDRFLKCIGGLPFIPENPSHEVTARREYDGFALENVVLETRPDYYATCSVYTPLDGKKVHPAVLLPIGHTDAGKADMEYQYAAQLFCRAGFTVLALDPFGEGERFEHYDLIHDFQPIQGCSGEHDLMDWKFKLMGLSLARYFVADALSALNYLKNRADVDESRVALTGHSGGGTQVSMLMLAGGDEFACAAPCAYITDNRAMIEEGVDPDNEMLWPGSLKEGIDYADILLAVAPKPVAVLANAHDFFPPEGTKRAVDEARAVVQRVLKSKESDPSPIELITAQSEHAYGPTLAKAALSLFSRCLLGHDTSEETLKAFRFSPLPPAALEAAGGCLPKARPGMTTLQQEAERVLAQIEAERAGTQNSLKSRLSDLIGIDHVEHGNFRVYKEGVCAPYAYLCFVLRQEQGIWLNGVLLRPMSAGDEALPADVMLWPGGTARIAEHSFLIHETVAKGRQAIVLDLPGEGALLPAKLGGSDMYISWSTMYKLNAYLIQLGDSLAALRARGTAALLRALEGSDLAEKDGVCLLSEGDMDRYALWAALLCGVRVKPGGACQSYEEIVSGAYHDQTHTHAWALPGVLKAFGSGEITDELKAKRKLL